MRASPMRGLSTGRRTEAGAPFLCSPSRGRSDNVFRHGETALRIVRDLIPPKAMARIALPDAPSVVAGHGRAAILTADGELLLLPAADAAAHLRGLPAAAGSCARDIPPPWPARHAGIRSAGAFRLRTARPPRRTDAARPRPGAGLRTAAGGLEAEAALLPELAAALLPALAGPGHCAEPRRRGARGRAWAQAGWGWAPFVIAALGRPDAAPSSEALRVWKRLPEWEDAAPPAAALRHPVGEAEARSRLAAMLGPARRAAAGPGRLRRRRRRRLRAARDPGRSASRAGRGRHRHRQDARLPGARQPVGREEPRRRSGSAPSPATCSARSTPNWPICSPTRPSAAGGRGAQGPRELPLPAELGGRAGAAASGLAPAIADPARPGRALGAGHRDGDILGGDLPGWLADLFGAGHDPRPRRPARRVHPRRLPALPALLRRAHDPPGPHRAACRRQPCAGDDPGGLGRARRQRRCPRATSSTRATTCSTPPTAPSRPNCPALEPPSCAAGCAAPRAAGRAPAASTAASRSWSRPRPMLETPLDAALRRRARCPRRAGPAGSASEHPELGGWMPAGQSDEAFLRLIRQQVLARAAGDGRPACGALECDVLPARPRRARGRRAARPRAGADRRAAATLRERLLAPPRRGGGRPGRRHAQPHRGRRPLAQPPRADPAVRLAGHAAGADRDRAPSPAAARIRSCSCGSTRARRPREIDVGLHRHWLDPTIPFAATLAAPAHGLLVTSATLRDAGDAGPGSRLGRRPRRASARRICRRRRSAPPSPARSTTPPRPAPSSSPTSPAGDIAQLAAAYRALFLAAGGGGLGLFTAIRRLQAVHARIAPELEEAGIPLYAQHVDAMGNATLVDIFRAEEDTCLLGTDAMRDGVDVPGRALRLVVFERVPWPRPDILHRERRIHLSAAIRRPTTTASRGCGCARPSAG